MNKTQPWPSKNPLSFEKYRHIHECQYNKDKIYEKIYHGLKIMTRHPGTTLERSSSKLELEEEECFQDRLVGIPSK